MVLRPRHGWLALFLVAVACNQGRTTEGAQPPPPTAPESEPSNPEVESATHDAPPEEVADSHPSPAAEQAPPAKVQAPLDARAIETAVKELAAWAEKKGGALGASIVDLRDGRKLASVHADRPVNPASNQKILTAAAALHYLGPAYRFRTELRGKISGSSVETLALVGNGDPSLGTQDLWRLVRVLKERGVDRVGSVLVDQSYFDEQFVPPAFEQQPNEWAAFRAPVSAVAVEGNTITLNVIPNGAGQKASFWFEPPGVVDSHGSIESRAKGSGDAVQWSLQATGPGGAARLRSEVSGGIGADLGRRRYTRRMEDPRLAPGYALKHVLSELGITVSGEVRLGKANAGDVLTYLTSESLARLLDPVGKDSNNFYAEMVLKAVGAAADKESSTPASTEAGARALLRWLERAGVRTEGTVIKNGSGLFDANRVAPEVIVGALAAAHGEPAISSEMVTQLAIGGVDGTLRNRFRKHAATRVIRAKTGTLRNVIALSGYVLAPGGRAPVAFSLLVVDVPSAPGEARQRTDKVIDQIVAALWSPQQEP